MKFAAPSPTTRYESSDPADIKWRVEQGIVDNAIEGIQTDPKFVIWLEEQFASGADADEIARKIGNYHRRKYSASKLSRAS